MYSGVAAACKRKIAGEQHSAVSIQPKRRHSDVMQIFADFPQQGGILRVGAEAQCDQRECQERNRNVSGSFLSNVI